MSARPTVGEGVAAHSRGEWPGEAPATEQEMIEAIQADGELQNAVAAWRTARAQYAYELARGRVHGPVERAFDDDPPFTWTARDIQERLPRGDQPPAPTAGTRLRQLREAAGLTQAELAERLTATLGRPVKQAEISRWESGGRTPRAAMMKILEQVLKQGQA